MLTIVPLVVVAAVVCTDGPTGDCVGTGLGRFCVIPSAAFTQSRVLQIGPIEIAADTPDTRKTPAIFAA
jgi:hypothetical protein